METYTEFISRDMDTQDHTHTCDDIFFIKGGVFFLLTDQKTCFTKKFLVSFIWETGPTSSVLENVLISQRKHYSKFSSYWSRLFALNFIRVTV